MITIFTLPKAFEGHIGVIQSNAIRSWKKIHKDIEIFLCGNDKGIAEFAQTEGLTHITNVETTDLGTPILQSVFREVRNRAKNEVLCFVNGDIIIFDDILRPIRNIPFNDYLMVGPRFNVDITEEYDFEQPDTRSQILSLVDMNVTDGKYGSDFFLFPKTSCIIDKIPPFAVGRPAWDNWMFFNARREEIPLIDTQKSVIDVHQNHDYNHVKTRHLDYKWEGPEGNTNRYHCFDSIMAGSQNPDESFKALKAELAEIKTLDGESQTERLSSLFQPYTFYRSEADYYINAEMQLQKYPLKERFFTYCKFAHILKPDAKTKNKWAYRLRNIWQKFG